MPRSRPIPQQQIIPTGVYFFRIDSAAAQSASNDDGGNPTQWIYQVTQMYKSGTGYTQWTAMTGGYSGNGYNFLEDANDGSGRQQNGVDHDTGTMYQDSTSFAMQPLQTNSIHPGVFLFAPSGSTPVVEVWLMPYSGEDGECA